MPPIKTLNRAYRIATAMESDAPGQHVTITISRRMTLMQRLLAKLGMGV